MNKFLMMLLSMMVISIAACSSDSDNNQTDGDTDTEAEIEADGDDEISETETDEDTVESDGDIEIDEDLEEEVEQESLWDYRAKWEIPVEEWSTCPDTEYLDGKTLKDKAAYYDWIVPKLHQVPTTVAGHEDYSRVFTVKCDANIPDSIVDDDQLPTCEHNLSENNGLWTGLYVASQAFRYAVTKDPEALAQLKRTLNGTYQMLLITGKDGLYTRDFRDPSIPQQYCIEDEPRYANAATNNEKYARYTPPTDRMVGNNFVKIDDDGCFKTWDVTLNDGNGDWLKHPEYCTDTKYAGFCWQNNVSKDEYAGHMFAAGIVAKIIDDPEVRAIAEDILVKVGHHLVDYGYWANDYDGRYTRYGSANAMSLDSFPGANAMLALTWTKMGAVVQNDQVLIDSYNDCLLQQSGELKCIDQPFETPEDYRTYLDSMNYMLGCGSNYDTISIGELAYFNLIWYENDLELRKFYIDKFRANTKGPDDDGRNLWEEGNPFRNFILASRMPTDDYDKQEVTTLVEDGICTLKQYHTDNIRRAKNNDQYDEWCVSERHGSLAETQIPINQRCPSIFEWWGDPNQRESCSENLKSVEPPAGYLLPYWMGRYFGYIDETM